MRQIAKCFARNTIVLNQGNKTNKKVVQGLPFCLRNSLSSIAVSWIWDSLNSVVLVPTISWSVLHELTV